MKKFLIFLIVICALFIICVYIFIPQKLEISKVEYINCNVNGAFRVLSNQPTWNKWWPDKDSINNSKPQTFLYKGFSYQLSEKYYHAIEVQMKTKFSTIDSRISLIKINLDSVVLIWRCQIPTSVNPVSRILKYREAENIRNNMADILSNLRYFLEDKENIYGINLHVVMSKDSTMVLTKSISSTYPTTTEIYHLIENLKKYIAGQGAKENNFPMLHVKMLSDSSYETMWQYR